MVKNKSFFLIFFIICFLNINSLNAAINIDNNEEKVDAIKVFKSFIDKVKIKKLDNGLTIIMYKRGFAPIFSGMVSVKVGGSDEKVGKTGISHFFEHMAFKGTKKIGTKNYRKEKKLLKKLESLAIETQNANKFTKEQKAKWDEINNELKQLWDDEAFSKEYEKRGAVNFNASTDKELTKYYVSLPKSEFEFWAKMEALRIKDSVMRQFYQERDVILEERRMRFENNPIGKLYEKFLQIEFLEHPYRNPVIGYEDDIKNLTATDVINYQKKYYIPSNMVVAVVGDIDEEKDFKILEKYFSRLPRGEKVVRNILKESKQEGQRKIELSLNSNPMLFVAYHKPNFPNIDDLRLSLIFYMLAGTKISPLYKELVENSKCVSSLQIDEGPGSAYPNFISFFIAPNGNCSNQKIVTIIKDVIKKYKKSGFKEDDFKIAKRNFLVSSMQGLNSNEYLADLLSETQLFYSDLSVLVNQMEDLEKIKNEDLIKTMKKYLKTDNQTIASIKNKARK